MKSKKPDLEADIRKALFEVVGQLHPQGVEGVAAFIGTAIVRMFSHPRVKHVVPYASIGALAGIAFGLDDYLDKYNLGKALDLIDELQDDNLEMAKEAGEDHDKDALLVTEARHNMLEELREKIEAVLPKRPGFPGFSKPISGDVVDPTRICICKHSIVDHMAFKTECIKVGCGCTTFAESVGETAQRRGEQAHVCDCGHERLLHTPTLLPDGGGETVCMGPCAQCTRETNSLETCPHFCCPVCNARYCGHHTTPEPTGVNPAEARCFNCTHPRSAHHSMEGCQRDMCPCEKFVGGAPKPPDEPPAKH